MLSLKKGILMKINRSVDASQLLVQEWIKELINDVHIEEGIPLDVIASEMISIATEISTGEYKIEHDNDDDDNDTKFEQSEIYKSIKSLSEKIDKFERIEEYEKVLLLREELVFQYPEYAQKRIEIIGNVKDFWEDEDFHWKLEPLMRGYVIKQDIHKMNSLLDLARKYHEIVGEEVFDIDVFEHDYTRFKNDMENFKHIYSFLQNNRDFLQKNLFKELSIDGRKSSYMLDWGTKLNSLVRTRYKDTWILNVKSQ